MPVKPLHAAKTRLRGAADRGVGDPDAHAALTLALAHDTVAAVRGRGSVRRLLVVSSDPVVAAELAAVGVEVVPDVTGGLNAALRHGAALLQRDDPAAPVGALQADLPALRPDGARRRRCTRRRALRRRRAAGVLPGCAGHRHDAAARGAAERRSTRCFGARVGARHRASGAVALRGAWPGLRRDVDTGDDLCAAVELGVGPHTRAVLAPTGRC